MEFNSGFSGLMTRKSISLWIITYFTHERSTYTYLWITKKRTKHRFTWVTLGVLPLFGKKEMGLKEVSEIS